MQTAAKVSMTRKFQNYTLQTNSWHREVETQNMNIHMASGRQIKQSNQSSLPQHDDCKTIKGTMYCITEERPNITPPQTMRELNNSLEGTAVKATVWLKCILLARTKTAVVKTRKRV